MPLALLLTYPLCVHFAVVTGAPILQIIALCLLAVAVQYPGLRRGSLFSWGVLAMVVPVALWLATMDLAFYVLYLPPVIVPLIIWSGFMRTLLPGQVPLVTAIGEQVHGELPPEIERYTRRVTILWASVLAGLSLWSALLPWIGSELVWSVFSNFLNYALVGVLFIGDYIYRRWRFSYFRQPGFRRYLQILYQAGLRSS